MIAATTALAVTALFAIFFIRARANYQSLPEVPPVADGTPQPDCMVVIPARDEEAMIARAVASFPPDSVIVVDDASKDQTAAAARRAGAGVIPAPPVGPAQSGKSVACAEGARVLTSRWILFADADTSYNPAFLASAVAWAEASQLSFASFYLEPECETLALQVLVPYLRALAFTGPAGFNRQCLLVLRDAYEFVGGHGAVAASRVGELKLAANAARHRMKIGSARAGRLGLVRARSILRSVTLGTAGGWVTASAATCAALWLPVLAWLLFERQWLAAGLLAVLPGLLLWPWYRDWRAALAPVAIYGSLPFLFHVLIVSVTGRPIEWKGRRV